MAQVKFYRGLAASYNTSTHANCIYFATDTHELIMDNKKYGISESNAALLNNAITSVKWSSPDTLTFYRGDGTKEFLNVTFPVADSSTQGLMAAAHVVKLTGIEEGAQVNVIENVTVDGVTGSLSGKTLAINGGFAKAADVYTKGDVYTKDEIAEKLSSVYEYKGSVNTYAELPSNAEKGDVYNVAEGYNLHPAGTNWVFDGTSWDALGGLVDMSELEGKVATNTTNIGLNTQAITNEQSRAEGVESQLRTDLGNKSDEANGTGSAFARIANLTALVGEMTGGSTTSISQQIADAKAELRGNASTDFDTLGELEEAIKEEAARAAAAEKANSEAITAEQQRAEGIEGGLRTDVNTNTAAIEALQGVDAGFETRIAANEAAITKLDGADTVEGSVKKQIKDAVQVETERATGVENSLAGRIQALESSVGEGGSVAEDIQANADAISALQTTVSDNETDIENKMTELAGRVTTAEGTITSHTTSIGENAAAITALQNNTVNGKKISTNPTLSGEDIALANYNADATNGFIVASDTVNTAIKKLENDLIWHEA